MAANKEKWIADAIAAGCPPEFAAFLIKHGVPHVHGPETVFIDDTMKTTLDEWADGVEEVLQEIEEGDDGSGDAGDDPDPVI